jgi:hypothetical protein
MRRERSIGRVIDGRLRGVVGRRLRADWSRRRRRRSHGLARCPHRLSLRRLRLLGEEERTNDVVKLEVKGVSIDTEGLKSGEAAKPRRERAEFVVPKKEGLQAGELGELRREGGEAA